MRRSLNTLAMITILVLAARGTQAQQAMAAQSVQAAGRRDTQAVAILTQALKAVGGREAISALQDFTATGSVNYYWGEGEQGTVVVKGRGSEEFRVDATLPEGVRSWAVGSGAGFVSEADGTTRQNPFQHVGKMGSLSFPYIYLEATLKDTTATNIAYVGSEMLNGAKVEHIAVYRNVGTGELNRATSKMTERDFYFDPATFYLVAARDTLHASDPKNHTEVDYLHEVRFSDYQKVGEVMVPFSIARFMNGQPVETIHLTQITFNGGLDDSIFSSR